MTVQKNILLPTISCFFGFSITPVINVVRDPANLPYSAIMLGIGAIVSAILYRWWNKRKILFKTLDAAFYIEGSKEGMFDPGTLNFDEIAGARIEGRKVVVVLKNGNMIRLAGLGRHKQAVLAEIQAKSTHQG